MRRVRMGGWPRRAKVWLGLVAMALAALALGYYLYLRADYALCDVEDQHVLNGPKGDSVTMDTRFCQSFFAGDPGTIVVRYRHAGEGEGAIAFVYFAASGDGGDTDPPWYPDIRWEGDNRISIAIQHVSQIVQQREHVHGVDVNYRIGKVDYPAAP